MAEHFKSKKYRIDGKSFKYMPVTILLFAVAIIIGLCGFFRVSNIVVTGASLYSEEEIIEASGIELGDNLLFFNSSKVGAGICSKLSYAGKVKVVVKLPSTVKIQMSESVAIASIENGGYYWIIDADGKILEQTDRNGAADTINIKGVELADPEEGADETGPAVGSVINVTDTEKLPYLTSLLNAIYSYNIYDKITELDMTSIANISFDYDGRFTVKFGNGSDETKKLDTLLEVIEQLESDDKGILEVTDNSVVHFIPA